MSLSDKDLEDIRRRTAFYRDWAKDVYESNIYGIDDRRTLVREIDRLHDEIRKIRRKRGGKP